MNEKRLIEAIKARVPFQVAKRLLTLAKYPIGVSWEKIEAKMKEQAPGHRDADTLLALYCQSLFCAEKSIAAYKVAPADMQALRDDARLFDFDANDPFVDSYPWRVAPGKMADLLLAKPVPVAYERVVGASILLFSTVRELEFREPLSDAELKPNAVSRYQKVFGVRVERVQTFDAVLVPDHGSTIYVLVDNQDGTNRETREIAHFATRTALNEFCKKPVLQKGGNLFPAITKLYNEDDGVVRSLSYATTTSSIKSERMRGSGKCLRQELFHKTGMEALGGHINAYEIGVEWSLPSIGHYTPHPRLDISGTYKMTYDANPHISEASVSGCGTYDDLKFVLEKMGTYLQI